MTSAYPTRQTLADLTRNERVQQVFVSRHPIFKLYYHPYNIIAGHPRSTLNPVRPYLSFKPQELFAISTKNMIGYIMSVLAYNFFEAIRDYDTINTFAKLREAADQSIETAMVNMKNLCRYCNPTSFTVIFKKPAPGIREENYVRFGPTINSCADPAPPTYRETMAAGDAPVCPSFPPPTYSLFRHPDEMLNHEGGYKYLLPPDAAMVRSDLTLGGIAAPKYYFSWGVSGPAPVIAAVAPEMPLLRILAPPCPASSSRPSNHVARTSRTPFVDWAAQPFQPYMTFGADSPLNHGPNAHQFNPVFTQPSAVVDHDADDHEENPRPAQRRRLA